MLSSNRRFIVATSNNRGFTSSFKMAVISFTFGKIMTTFIRTNVGRNSRNSPSIVNFKSQRFEFL